MLQGIRPVFKFDVVIFYVDNFKLICTIRSAHRNNHTPIDNINLRIVFFKIESDNLIK